MYKFCAHQYALTYFDTYSLPNCGLDFTADCGSCEIEDTDCQRCSEGCSLGCIRTSDCNLCLDMLCTSCNSYAGACDSDGCISNAVSIEGVCECQPPFFYMADSNTCTTCPSGCASCTSLSACDACLDGFYLEIMQCLPCNENCAQCSGSQNCENCEAGYYLRPGTAICLATCPSGFLATSGVCSEEQSDFTFVFSDKTINLTSGGVTLTPSNTQPPKPMYARGIYFDGDDTLDLSGLVINAQFTLEYWIKMNVDREEVAHLLYIGSDYVVVYLTDVKQGISVEGESVESE